ncbi:MAG: PEP-CTERM sorting domain-containing protein [Candidatus Brocadiae bacterium]|nr:PEP-CTERM sorting domain-containing protein [Candidatus Brocadiia bacterium]
MRKFFLILFLACLIPVFAVGPIGEYYVVNWVNNGMHVLQNNSVLRSWSTGGNRELAVVVEGNSVKTMGYDYNAYGREYSLSGTVLGPSYTNPFSGIGFHDGATDGTYFYSWAWHNQTLYRFDKNWANGTALFGLSGKSRLAITYDPTNNSLWLSGYNDASYTMQNYTLSGSLITSFSVADYNTGGLAMDYNDGTLWYSVSGGETFRQYSRTGTLLQTVTISGAGSGIWGGEFKFNSTVPEPSSLAMLFLTLLSWFFFRNKQ